MEVLRQQTGSFSNIQEAIERQFYEQLASLISPGRRMSLLEWTKKYRVNERGMRFEFTRRPFLKKIYEDTSPQIIIMKAAQLGGTEYAISRMLHFCDQHNVTCIYTFPTESDVFQFVAGRLDPAIRKSPYLTSKIGRIDSRTVKEFAESFIYFKGSWTKRHALSVPADMLVHDEVDSSNPAILRQYKDRLTASPWKIRIQLSTPSVPRFGIHALWLESTQNEWFLRCDHCVWAGLPTLDDIDEKKRALRCPRCGSLLERRHGFWVEGYPGREIVGYHLDQLTAACIPVADIIDKLKGPEAYSKRHFENSVRGLPSMEGVGAVNRAIILSRCFNEPVTRSETGTHRYMGVDTNDWIHIVVSEVFEGKRHIVFMMKTQDWEDIRKQIHLHQVDIAVIDLRPEPRMVKAIADDFPGKVYYAEYVRADDEVQIDPNDPARLKVSRTLALDATAEQIREGKVQVYPLDKDIEEWIQAWEGLHRVKETDRFGREYYVWRSSGPDHYAHADVYNRLATLLGIESEVVVASGFGIPEAFEEPEGFLSEVF